MSDSAVSENDISDAMREMAANSIDSLQKIFSSAPEDLYWDEIKDRLAKGEVLKNICGISDEFLEKAYDEGKDELSYRHFEEAQDIFSKICAYDQQTPKYWAGLAKSCEGLGNYSMAVDCYKMMTLLTGGTEPLTFLCMGFCYLSLNDKKNALDVLESGKEVADPTEHKLRAVLDQIDYLIKICKQ